MKVVLIVALIAAGLGTVAYLTADHWLRDKGAPDQGSLAMLDRIRGRHPTPEWPKGESRPDRSDIGGSTARARQSMTLPTRTPSPTPEPTDRPENTPVPVREILARAWASCNGRHIGVSYQKRRDAAESVLDRGLRSQHDLSNLIAEHCEGAYGYDPAEQAAQLAGAQSRTTSVTPWPTAEPTRNPEGYWFTQAENGRWIMHYLSPDGVTTTLEMPDGWIPSPDDRVQRPSTGNTATATPTPWPTATPQPTRRAARGTVGYVEQVGHWAVARRADRETTDKMLEQDWASDGLNAHEFRIATSMMNLTQQGEGAAVQAMLDMEFLNRPDRRDAATLETLTRLHRVSRDAYEEIRDSRLFQEGLDDDEALMIAALEGPLHHDGPAAFQRLEHGTWATETRSISTSQSERIELVIVRQRDGHQETMDLLEDAVRDAERFMGAPLPLGLVIVTIADRAVNAGTHGTSYGATISIDSQYEKPEREAQRRLILAHEVAHHYWRDNAGWLDEGMAELIAITHRRLRLDGKMEPNRPPCRDERSLQEMDAQGSPTIACHYASGQRMMLAVMNEVGEVTFRETMRDLYDQRAGPSGRPLGYAELSRAFPDSAAVDIWYRHGGPAGGRPTAERPNPAVPEIGGEILSVTTKGDGATGLTLRLEYEHDGNGRSARVEIALYYEDGMAFMRGGATLQAHRNARRSSNTFHATSANGWRAGRYWAEVRHDGRLVARTEWRARRRQ